MQTKLIAEVWSQGNCTYCTQAKALLTKHSIPYNEIIVDSDTKDTFFKKFPGAKTVPQILLNDKCIGGFSELQEILE